MKVLVVEDDRKIAAALRRAETGDIPLPSLEGFVRQIAGWREFIRGVYQNYSEQQQRTNMHRRCIGFGQHHEVIVRPHRADAGDEFGRLGAHQPARSAARARCSAGLPSQTRS